MNTFFKKAGACLRLTWVWSLILVLSAALFVWLIGPSLAVDDYRFWASPTSRLLSICAVFLAWGLAMVFAGWRAGVRSKTDEDSQDSARQARIDKEQGHLQASFTSALQMLKGASLYRGRSERWRDELPWYLLIGPQGSGKTSFLAHSGLRPSNDRFEPPLASEGAGSRRCEWYFADNGVLIDTAGCFLTQPEGEVDSRTWKTLLGLLRKRRRSRPLNGILVLIPAYELLNPDAAQLHEQASQVRARLQEVQQMLHVQVPVYLVMSKVDDLSGFSTFFDRFTREESAQVLGARFDKEQDGTDKEVLRAAFEALLERLNSQVIRRMHQERDSRRCGDILDFPRQLAQVAEGIGCFIEKAFEGSRYLHGNPLRGIYLTSAMSHGQPLVSGHGGDRGTPIDTAVGHGTERAYFIEHLFSRVIFPDADLVGLDKRERRRIHRGQRLLYAGALAVLACMALLWTGGFSANYERLEKLRDLTQTWTREHSLLKSDDDAMAALNVLDARYAATQIFPSSGVVGYRERGGLYQGDEVAPVVSAAYARELEEQLLPRVAILLETQIRTSLDDRERLLNSLRAYLMLNMQEHRDRQWLKDWVASEWSLRHGGHTAVQDGLNGHLGRLLEQPFTYPLNEPLVAQARQILRSEPLVNIVYRTLREQARDLPIYRLSQHLGPQGSMFSGADYAIPGFYTRDGYQRYFSVQGALVLPQILKDNWVMGEGAQVSAMDLRRLKVELEQLYFRDYANHWGEAVAQMTLPAINDFADGAQQLSGLTSAHSPIVHLLVQVRDNTRFPTLADAVETVAGGTVPLPVPEKTASLGQLAVAAASTVSAAVAEKLPDAARRSLQSRFEPLHRLLNDDNGPAADLVLALTALNDVQVQMDSLARATSPEQVAFDMARLRMSGQRDALSNLRNASGRLPRPVGGWFNVVAEDAWRLVLSDSYHYLNQRYQNELYSFYGRAISKRYPFNAHSASDVALNDFREFFKTQGIAERFFDNYMRPFVSGDPGNYRLRSVDGLSLPISRTYLEQMTTLAVIRQSFFADDPAEPRVRFKLEPYTLDPAVSRSEFRLGDKSIEYRHGPILPVSFNWPVDAEDGRTSLVLDRMAGQPLGIEKNTGPWSLFRFVDLMQTEYLKGRDVLVLKADVGGLRANYLLTSQRMPNPFDMGVLRTFRMPVQL